MIILLEGPDKCGKSTLAKNLSSLLDMPVKKHSETGSAYEAVGRAVEVLDSYNGKNEIWDRFYYPSDLIYGKIAGGYEISKALRGFYQSWVKGRLDFYDTVVVYCYAPIEKMITRLNAEPDHYVNEQQLREVKDEYDEMLLSASFSLPVIRLNSDLLNEEEMVIEFYNQLLKIQGVL